MAMAVSGIQESVGFYPASPSAQGEARPGKPERKKTLGRLDVIFKAYDIRGRVDNGDLDEEAARAVGRAFAAFTGAERAAVGRDFRESSDALAGAFASGANQGGMRIVDLGRVPTDAVYFCSGHMDIPGAMITASHNPAEYNGIKLCRRGAAPIGAETGLPDIQRLAMEARTAPPVGGAGRMTEFYDPIPDYLEHLLGVVDPAWIGPRLTAADGGNGMAGVALERLFQRLPARLSGLYLEPDPAFPNHPADPLQPANLTDLIAKVRAEGADLGVAFDGDADRAVFVDETGTVLSGSVAVSIISTWYLDREPGARIVHNLICSRAVPEIIRERGGEPIRTRVGHSFIKQVMAQEGAVFGGEHSGHYYFRDNYGADSGMLAMLVLLAALTESGETLSGLRRRYERYAASGEINLPLAGSGRAERVMRAAGEAFPEAEKDFLDGVTVDLGDRWFNLRPSNTEPLLRLNAEAPDRGQVRELTDRVRALVSG